MWKKNNKHSHAHTPSEKVCFHLVCSTCSLFFRRHFYLTALLPMKMLLLLRLQLLFFCSLCSSVFTKNDSELLWFSANEHFHYRTITNKGRWNIWHIFIENRIIDRKFQKIEIKHTRTHNGFGLLCFNSYGFSFENLFLSHRRLSCIDKNENKQNALDLLLLSRAS